MINSIKNQIKLEELIIMNFGSFYGDKHKIKFSSESVDRPITLIEGIVGRGKTTIFQLIYWVIFGDEFKIENSSQSDQLKFLRYSEFLKAVNRLAVEDGDEIRVGGLLKVLKIVDGVPIKLTVERYRTVKPGKNELIDNGLTLNVSKDGELLHNPHDYLTSLINHQVRDFLFIHGESLDQMLKKHENIKYFAMNLSDHPQILETLDALSRAMIWVSAKLKEEQKDNSKLSKVNNEIEELQKKLQTLEEESKNLDILIQSCENDIQRIRMEQTRIGEVDENARELNVLRAEELSIKNDLDELRIQRSKILKTNLPYVYLEKAFKICQADLRQKKIDGIWPNRITQEVVNDVLNLSSCLGIPWTPQNRELVQQFSEKLPSSSTEELNNILTQFDLRIESELKMINERKKQILSIYLRYMKKQGELEQKRSIINDLLIENEDIDEEVSLMQQLNDLMKEIQEKQRELTKYEVEKEGLDNRIEGVRNELKNRNQYRSSIETQMEKKYEHTPVKRLIEDIITVNEAISLKFEQIILQSVSMKLSEVYKRLVPDVDTWEDISVREMGSKGWEIIARRKYDDTVIETYNLSTGQASLLSLAYMITLNQLLDIRMPLVYDSMFVNLSSREKEKAASLIPQYYQGGQIILFAKNSEFEPILEILKPFISKSYKLIHSSSSGSQIESSIN